MAALAENPPPGGVCGLIIGYLVIAFTKTFSIMKKYSVFLLTIALAATGCEREDQPLSPDEPEAEQTIYSEPEDDSLTFDSTGDPTSDDDISTTTFAGKITVTFSDTDNASVKGDSYGYVTVDGNKVTVNNTGGEVLIYELTGTTANGFFKVYGAKKQAIVLNGASITNPDGAALNNQNKKRTFIVVKGSNKLSDSESAAYVQEGEEDLKAVLFSEAQLIFSGSGLLTVNALNKQDKSAIATDDYIRLMDNPTIKVNSGSAAGHGFKGKDYVQLSSGSLVVKTAAALKKGITSDDYVLVEGGTHTVTVTGGVAYDEEDAEYSGTAGVKADNYFAMTGGSLTIENTGNGGKGINAGSYDFDATNHTLSDSYISGGTLEYQEDRPSASPTTPAAVVPVAVVPVAAAPAAAAPAAGLKRQLGAIPKLFIFVLDKL